MLVTVRTTAEIISGIAVILKEHRDRVERVEWLLLEDGTRLGRIRTDRHSKAVWASALNHRQSIATEDGASKDQAFADLRRWIVALHLEPTEQEPQP